MRVSVNAKTLHAIKAIRNNNPEQDCKEKMLIILPGSLWVKMNLTGFGQL